jgi:glutathione synthase/RimK-type ligase-like ATP-grasp enzyme
MSILFVNGVSDSSVMGVNLDDKGRLVYLVDGNCTIHNRLPLKKGLTSQVMLFGKGVKQPGMDLDKVPSLIFNQISDADTHRGALERCVDFCEQVNTTVVNHPKHVLQTGRDRVSELLQDIPGVIMPRTLRFRPRSPQAVLEFAVARGIEFPFIVRVAGDHAGKSMIRLDKADDLAVLHALPFDGRDFYLTQFVDYSDEDGLYHKHRIIVIDGKPLLRHALYSNEWIVHANSRAFMMERDTWEQDVARFDRLSKEELPRLRPAIDEITSRLQLEYYGIDCCMRPDGQMVVFEANANMNILHGPNPASRYRVEAIEQELYKLLTRYSGEKVI